jgi:hypothetical protein
MIYLYSMRHDQPKAFELRRQGKTYREIEAFLDVSRSTLCDWFKNENWSKHIKKLNINKNIKLSTLRLEKLHEGRKLMLEKKYKQVEEDALKEFEIYKNDPLFMAGLMVYAGEGDKSSRNLTRMSNSEFYLHLVFIRFSERFLNIGRNKIKFWLLLYPDHNIEECTDIWSKKLNVNKSNFNKPQVILGKSTLRKLQYGVGNSIISSTSLKKKMMKWIELCKLYFD